MKATLKDMVCLTAGPAHHAFTDLTHWHGKYWCAYRTAQSHHIVPKGDIHLQSWDMKTWKKTGSTWKVSPRVFTHPYGDMRDPKFFATEDVLYLYCGIYLPHPALRHISDTLQRFGGDNILMTHIAHTLDGEHWSDFSPILRPNYWGWSMVYVDDIFLMASYHTGSESGDDSSVALWAGESPYAMRLLGAIYNVDHIEKYERRPWWGAHYPSEPLLLAPLTGDAHAWCYVRTETGMAIGMSGARISPRHWRWTHTDQTIHPGAVLETSHGVLLAGRQITRKDKKKSSSVSTTTQLYLMDHATAIPLLTLPSARDTGYCGMVYGETDDDIYLSWYSQHEMQTTHAPKLAFAGAQVYVARIGLSA